MSTRRKYERTRERFYWLLEKRELSAELLAEMVGTSRAHLCLVINGTPGRGERTRRRIAQLRWPEDHAEFPAYVLTDEMLSELGWTREGNFIPVGVG